MAEIALSGFLSDASGKLGGSVIFRRNGKLLQRAWQKPTNHKTSYQTVVRDNWALLYSAWGALTEDQRFSWKFAAAQIKYSNRIGTKFTPTAQQLFMRCNQNLFSCGLPMLSSFVSPYPFISLNNPSAVFVSHAIFPHPVTSFIIDFPGQTTAANLSYLIFCSNALSSGISNGKKYLRLIGAIPAGQSDSFDVLSLFAGRYGFALSYSGKVFLMLKPIDINSGFSGQELNFSCIITN